jgi:hypothetical protein
MKRYQPSTHRTAFGLLAFALTAITFGLAVFVPAQMGSPVQDVSTLASKVVTPVPTEVVINPAHIEVVGVRESLLAGNAQPGGKAARDLQARAEPDHAVR